MASETDSGADQAPLAGAARGARARLERAAAVAGAGLALALPFPYFLVRYTSRRLQRAVLLAVIVPFWTSYLLRVYAWQAILGERGALNQALQAIGILDAPSRLFVYNHIGVVIC